MKKTVVLLMMVLLSMAASAQTPEYDEFGNIYLDDGVWKHTILNNSGEYLGILGGTNEWDGVFVDWATEIEIPQPWVEIDGQWYDITVFEGYHNGPFPYLEKITVPYGYEKFSIWSNTISELVLPSSVTTIGSIDLTNMPILTLPESVTKITDNAFWNTSYSEINLPSSLEYIGSYAFRECNVPKLVIPPVKFCQVDWPYGVAYENNEGYAVFASSGLESVEFLEGNTEVPQHAFSDCSYLKDVKLAETTKIIKGSAFYNCQALESIEIPDAVTQIDGSAFQDCLNLCNIKLSNNLTALPAYLFESCSSLQSISIPKSVKKIGNDAFRGCENMSYAEFASIKDLCNISFDGAEANPLTHAHHLYIKGNNTEITDLVIPNDVNSIGTYAFNLCASLKSVSIPSSVTKIDDYAFSGCEGLEKAEFESIKSMCKISYGNFGENPLSYAHHLYLKGNDEEVTEIVIPDDVTSINGRAFAGGSSLKSVYIPKSVTSIGYHAFWGCKNIKEIRVESPTPIEFSEYDSPFWDDCYKCKLIVPKGSAEAYKAAEHWNRFKVLEEGYEDLPLVEGDVNGDREVTERDLRVVTEIIIFNDYSDADGNPDVNGDGKVDIADVTASVNNLYKKSAAACEAIDLGLPSGTLWAAYNLGALTPEGSGYFFSWGEIEGSMSGKENFSWLSYDMCTGYSNQLYKYCYNPDYGADGSTDELTELEIDDDVAHAGWGVAWRIPSKEQFDELVNPSYTTTEWTSQSGVNGYKITSRSNGNALFLPASGYHSDNEFLSQGEMGNYWSRSLEMNSTSCNANTLQFSTSKIGTATSERKNGLTVRPVRQKK